ncbi:MAG TPA: glycerol-3-phosphate 1-O-acyltransferase PlsY [Thermohalobaculum sp.]|nr:glycerol-3-phosphate 1-O-acyltransferase PlsY [Thermohalobaculum sp.]
MPEIETGPIVLLLAAIGGYLLGSIPFGLVIARVMRLGDLRTIGSGNIGATNVLRTGNKTAAALTLLFDGGKAALAILAFAAWGEAAAQVAGLAAFLGHCWPVWVGFRGGKGVAAFIGIVLALHWPSGLVTCLTWAGAAAVTRISSAGALAAAAVGPLLVILFDRYEGLALAVVLALVVFWRHHANIARLLAGTEPRIGQR